MNTGHCRICDGDNIFVEDMICNPCRLRIRKLFSTVKVTGRTYIQEVRTMPEEVQEYADLMPNMRESKFEGEQVPVEELIDKTVKILAVNLEIDDRGETADYQIESSGKKLTFITASGPLKDAARQIMDKKLLENGPIKATLTSKKSKTSQFRYYVWE